MIKRMFDVLISSCLLVLLFPLMLFIAWQIRRKMGSPVFFSQIRPGLNGQSFKLIKFRTMSGSTDLNEKLLPDEQRLLPFGQFLRSTSLDELPELWNVLSGDMSLVGPRPLLCEYLPLYNDEQQRRHDVLPGITGWAQVNGRNHLFWEDKFKLDVWYVDNYSIWLDIKILLLTFRAVITRDGISSRGKNTVNKFMGN